MSSALLVLTMSLVTIVLRFLPFVVFKNNTPKWLSYLGKVLPPAIIGMLVIYCIKDITPAVYPFGFPEILSVICVAGIQIWKRNSIFSIIGGTVLYMLLSRVVF